MTQLERLLWPTADPTDGRVHALLDGARDRRIESLIRWNRVDQDCLYSGDLSPRLQAAAPYIVRLFVNTPFVDEFFSKGWGASWGVLAVTEDEVALRALRRHFRQFLKVKDQAGATLLFRFYDPRVLRVWLPTCTHDEAARFFGPVQRFITEGESRSEVHVFERDTAGVRVRTHTL
jgi:hypothetical protein